MGRERKGERREEKEAGTEGETEKDHREVSDRCMN